ncbi:hypothetical protein H1C71_005265, partial [Ictidomys tridecemlineatus]
PGAWRSRSLFPASRSPPPCLSGPGGRARRSPLCAAACRTADHPGQAHFSTASSVSPASRGLGRGSAQEVPDEGRPSVAETPLLEVGRPVREWRWHHELQYPGESQTLET